MRHAIGTICELAINIITDGEIADLTCHLNGQIVGGEALNAFNAGDALASGLPEGLFSNTICRHDTQPCDDDTSFCSVGHSHLPLTNMYVIFSLLFVLYVCGDWMLSLLSCQVLIKPLWAREEK